MNTLLDILLFFFENPQEEFVGRQIALKFDMPNTTTYKKLNILANKGFLIKNHKNYKLDPKLILKLKSSLRAIST